MATDAEKGLALLKSVVADHDHIDYDDPAAESRCRACLAGYSLITSAEARNQVKAFLESVEVGAGS